MNWLKPLFFLILCTPLSLQAEVDEGSLWQGIKSGEYVAMLRHALAPGTGDPDNFQVDDCSTQRNLSDKGREQAQRIGQRFKDNGIEVEQIFSSQWCRCLDTANKMALGEVTELPIINSFFRDYGKGPKQTLALKEWLLEQTGEKPIILVTHQVNITGLTDVFPSSGEIVIFKRPVAGEAENLEIEVVGTLETDYD